MTASKKLIIVGAGISGLAAAIELERTAPGWHAVVLESSRRVGGIVRTERHGQYVIDPGPDNFVVSKPHAAQMCRSLGLGDALMETKEENRRVLMRRNGVLRPLPAGMFLAIPGRLDSFLRSGVLSLRGRLRATLEWALPRLVGSRGIGRWWRGEHEHDGLHDNDESIGSFIGRRLGHEMVEQLAEPLMAGIYAGNVHSLSIHSTFPQVVALEREHGGLIRGVRHLMRERGTLYNRQTLPPSPFLTLKQGMGALPDAMRDALRTTDVRLGAVAVRVEHTGSNGKFVVHTQDGMRIDGDAVLLCVPLPVCAGLVDALEPDAAELLREVNTSSTATVFLAWPQAQVTQPPHASGLLIPRTEGLRMTAATVVNAKWRSRAPSTDVFVRVFYGGMHDEGTPFLEDHHLIDLAVAEIGPMLGVDPLNPPKFSKVFRWLHCNPQPDVGHASRMTRVQTALARTGNIGIATGGFRGIGIPDCIKNAQESVRNILQFTAPVTQIG